MSKRLHGRGPSVVEVRNYLDLMDPHHNVTNFDIEQVFLAIEDIEAMEGN